MPAGAFIAHLRANFAARGNCDGGGKPVDDAEMKSGRAFYEYLVRVYYED